jgi:hypothetical protein
MQGKVHGKKKKQPIVTYSSNLCVFFLCVGSFLSSSREGTVPWIEYEFF